MINPQFLIHHPIDLSPLARSNDDNPLVTDRFQLVVNTWEVVNAYSELVDAIDQRERLVKQAQARDTGDEEAMVMEEDFVYCMEYGMPPISGWGMGIDRFTALLTNQENLREVVLFPLMKPIDYDAKNCGELADDVVDNNNNAIKPFYDDEVLEPLDIENLGVDYQTLDNFFADKIKKESLINHSIASAAIMQGVARKFGLNEKNYYYLGLLHDIDLEEFQTNVPMHSHGLIGGEWLKKLGMDETSVNAIISHNEEGNGFRKITFLDFALTAAENLSGLIAATAKVYPDKKVASVKVNSVVKRMKEKAFAATVNRENIKLCKKLGLTLEEFVSIV